MPAWYAALSGDEGVNSVTVKHTICLRASVSYSPDTVAFNFNCFLNKYNATRFQVFTAVLTGLKSSGMTLYHWVNTFRPAAI
jgi:hypothetical protein